MAFDKQFTRQAIYRTCIAALLAAAFYVLTGPVWLTPTAFVSFHALLAFLAITAGSYAFLLYHNKPFAGNWVFLVALLTRVVVYMSIATEFMVSGSAVNLSMVVTSDLFGLCAYSLFVLLAILLTYKEVGARCPTCWKALVVVLAAAALLGQVILYGGTLHIMTLQQKSSFGLICGITAIMAFLVSMVLWSKLARNRRFLDSSLLLPSFSSFALSILAMVLNQLGLAGLWRLSLLLQAAAFTFLLLAIALPHYRSSRVERSTSYAILSWLMTIVMLPFVLGLISEVYVPGIRFVDYGVYFLSHGLAALLSGMMAVLIFIYFRRNPAWNLVPYLTLFLVWALLEFSLLFSYDWLLWNYSEVQVPYVIGAMVSLFVIYRATMWTLNPPKTDPRSQYRQWITIRFLIILALLVVSRSLEAIVSPFLQAASVGKVLMLVLNILALFGFSILFFVQAKKKGSWKSIEGVALIFLAYWIMPSILKSVFAEWSIGWWLAEAVLLTGLTMGPPLLGSLYLDTMAKAQDSQKRATLFSDLLAHDITNMHQAILIALSIIEAADVDKKSKEMALADAKRSLERAAHIVDNVREIGLADQIGADELSKTDIVTMAIEAYRQVSAENPDEAIDFEINKFEGECYVLANNLLMDLFYNLFKNAVKYSNHMKRIDMHIEETCIGGGDRWEIRVTDYGKGIEEKRKKSLFERFMRGADGTGLGLSVVLALTASFHGQITVEDRVPGDHTKGTVFVLVFPQLAV
jgi:signal transduction histidine kinase